MYYQSLHFLVLNTRVQSIKLFYQILSDGAGLRSLGERNSKNKGHHQLRGKIMLPQVRTYEPCLV